MVKLLLLGGLLLLLSPVYAVVCKTINDDGVVSYADIPAEACKNPVKLRELSRYEPVPLNTRPPAQTTGQPIQHALGYQNLKISQPEHNAAIRNNEGVVAIIVSAQPVLQGDHRLQLVLDGNVIAKSFSGLSVTLTGVERGTHTLSAQIVDKQGVVLKTSDPISFTLHKMSVLNRPNT